MRGGAKISFNRWLIWSLVLVPLFAFEFFDQGLLAGVDAPSGFLSVGPSMCLLEGTRGPKETHGCLARRYVGTFGEKVAVELVGSSPTTSLPPLSLRVLTSRHSNSPRFDRSAAFYVMEKEEILQPPTFLVADFSFPFAEVC